MVSITDSLCSKQITSLSRCTASPDSQKSRNFLLPSMEVEVIKDVVMNMLSVGVSGHDESVPALGEAHRQFIATLLASSGVISPGLKDCRIW